MILLLALFAAQAADDPLQALRKTLDAAETVRVEFEMHVERGDIGMKGRLLFKGKDRFHLQAEVRRGKDHRVESGELFFDGRHLVARGALSRGTRELKADQVARARDSLVEAPVLMLFQSLFGRHGALPTTEDVQDRGTVKVDGQERRVVEYAMKMGGHPGAKVALHLDPKTGLPLRREVLVDQTRMVETYAAFAVGEPIPDEAFLYATKGRLASALAGQLARSVELHRRFTGVAPASLEALAARPDGLDPALFWPEGGFVLGGRVPKDPWGRPFALENKDGGLRVVSLGADGRPGGLGDDADATAALAPVPAARIAAPTERLRRHYAARVTLHLTAAAARAYADAYGVAPRELLKEPEGAYAPEGGWLPGGMPKDPWGDPLELVPGGEATVVRVKDAAARAVKRPSITPEERAALDAATRPSPTPERLARLRTLVAAMSGDDPDARDQAEADLRREVGPDAGLLDGAIEAERDPETKARLERVRSSVRRPSPAWQLELGRLTVVVPAERGLGGGASPSNERNASATLKTFASAQADFRANDRDDNKVHDFWAGDVAGLYALTSQGGEMIKLIELSAALADAAPLAAGDANGRIGKLEGVWAPKAGYFFQVLTTDASVTPAETYAQDTQGQPNLGKLFNPSRFGFCAFPAEYGSSGTRTFIINEGNTIYWTDTGGEPVLEWPDDATLKAEWKKLD
ncbi:MAG TPA: DUF2950 family protein [Planctomycetota bacterium]|nr:DUF2950 family protein [Planctomycetota bacterium]